MLARDELLRVWEEGSEAHFIHLVCVSTWLQGLWKTHDKNLLTASLCLCCVSELHSLRNPWILVFFT